VPLRSVEAATRDDAIAAAREQFGASARVVGVRRVRSGGVLGFFATERYVAEVDPDQSTRPPVPAPARGSSDRSGRGSAPARNGAAAYAAEAQAGYAAGDDDHGDEDRGHDAPARPRPGGARSGLTPAERIAAASALDAPARRPDDDERLDELAGLLGTAAPARDAAARSAPAARSVATSRSSLAAALAAASTAGPSAMSWAPTATEPSAERAFFPRASMFRSNSGGPSFDDEEPGAADDEPPAAPATPSPFTAALARMVSGDRDVRQAVQEALDVHAAPPASRGSGSRPTWPGPDSAPTATRTSATQQEDSTVRAPDVAPASAIEPDVAAPRWAEPEALPAHDASREAAIAEVLRTALAQGHSDEALADILRRVLAGTAPQAALSEPALPAPAPSVEPPAADPLGMSVPVSPAPSPAFDLPVAEPSLASLLHPVEEPVGPVPAEPAQLAASEEALPEPAFAAPVAPALAEPALAAPALAEPALAAPDLPGPALP
jgi:hypothetical protein